MNRNAFWFIVACFLIGIAGCKPNTDLQAILEDAKTALLTKDVGALGDSALALLKQYLPAESQNKTLKELLKDNSPFDKPHAIWSYCTTPECQWLVKSYAKLSLRDIKTRSFGLPFNEFVSYSKLLHQGKQAAELFSCVLLDTLALFERTLPTKSTEAEYYFYQLEKGIQDFKLFSPDGLNEPTYQLVVREGQTQAHLDNCENVSLAYTALKGRIKNFMSPNAPLPVEVEKASEHLFYESLLMTKFENLRRAIPPSRVEESGSIGI